ncbi:hypothetical protein [Phreatobacter sp.]|uniref:hypothetical protein n=1 Tax=Phreatobacter sp. TaxID=1966341 RepID=UPI0022C2E227|nr:hypothetical protein [Phreatobacter sp.]MCZ8314909.1 hypothetical protein [Phreatobacter sp.]
MSRQRPSYRRPLRSMALFGLALLAVAGAAFPAAAQTRSIVITDEHLPDGTLVTRHIYRCDGCPVRRVRAGTWRQQPTVDYGQALPIYQPPIYSHPPEVMPVRPGRPRSGPYAVTGAPRDPFTGRLPMGPRPPYYPSGSDARVITMDDPVMRQPARAR